MVVESVVVDAEVYADSLKTDVNKRYVCLVDYHGQEGCYYCCAWARRQQIEDASVLEVSTLAVAFGAVAGGQHITKAFDVAVVTVVAAGTVETDTQDYSAARWHQTRLADNYTKRGTEPPAASAGAELGSIVPDTAVAADMPARQGCETCRLADGSPESWMDSCTTAGKKTPPALPVAPAGWLEEELVAFAYSCCWVPTRIFPRAHAGLAPRRDWAVV